MTRYLIASVALAALSLPATAVEPTAIEPPQITGTTCLPVSGPYRITASKVTFKTGKTGLIVLHCAVKPIELQWADVNNLAIVATYRDTGGGAAGGRVKATLVGTDKVTGALTSVLQFNSNEETPASGVTVAVGHEIPAISAATRYMMRVELKRASTSQTVEFYGASYEFP